MQTVRRALAACAALAVLAGCGAAEPDAPARAPLGASDERAALPGAAPAGGELTALGDGLTIAVSAPQSFVPTSSASPAVARAVGFEMTVRNEGAAPYRPTLLALTAHVGADKAQQVVDSTQGYGGLVGAEEISPGQSLRFSIAFAAPAQKTGVRVVAKPDPAATAAVTVFDGEA
ncbi:hypothetical protein ACFPM7_18220 [Actinokineospora guangxiensis]|uniref:DUF4352 domain-containing protein n=1 Tax=Actinokineospora guangxiensis TaxID=1490288 RepID=A0ABW0ERK4_9PSEU